MTMPRDDKRQADEMNVQDKKAKRGGKTKTVAAASKREPAKARVVRGRPKAASKAASTRGKAKSTRAKAGSARSKTGATRAKAAKSLAKTAKTAVKRVKRTAARGAKTAMAVEKSILKTTKNIVKAATPKRRRKKTVASVVAKSRRQNAKTDYNPLHMLAKLTPF
jgi:hypothetical protein